MTSKRNRLRGYLEDYFELRRFERYGLVIVIFLGLICFSVRLVYEDQNFTSAEDLDRFLELSSSERSSLLAQNNVNEEKLTLIAFNPNTIDQAALLAMGLPPTISSSIVNYRNAGFEYSQAEDLLKCYGMNEVIFDELLPFIRLESKVKSSGSTAAKPESKPQQEKIQAFDFDPNLVSREELVKMNLPARFINGFLNYRNSGARFYDSDDLDKVYVLTDEIKAAISSYVTYPPRPVPNTVSDRETENLKPRIAERFRIDPNRITVDSLLRLGLSDKVARAWVNFREKGKVYRSMDDIRSIYGLSEEQLAEIADLIDFPAALVPEETKETILVSNSLSIDPNKATIDDLVKIKGIGRYYANQILWRKKQLGGFYHIDQIGESENLPDSVFQKIRIHFNPPTLDSLRLINVNTVRRRTFADHPYISYDRVNRIISHREFVGRIENLDYLVKVELLTPSEAKLLKPYLIFDER